MRQLAGHTMKVIFSSFTLAIDGFTLIRGIDGFPSPEPLVPVFQIKEWKGKAPHLFFFCPLQIGREKSDLSLELSGRENFRIGEKKLDGK